MRNHHKYLTIKQKLIIANTVNKSPDEICKKYGISLRTYQRIKQKFGTPNSIVKQYNQLKADYFRLKEHSKKQEEMIAVLQASDAKYSDSTKEKLNAADKLYPHFHPRAIIAALGVSEGGFFNHIYRNKKDKSWFNVRRERLKPLIQKIYDESGDIYGAKKIAGVLRNQGIVAGEPFVRDIMRELGIHGQETKKLPRRIVRQRQQSTNRLVKEYGVYRPNVLWVTDFTQMEISGDKVYLCVYIDVFSRMAVGYSFSSVADTKLVKRALTSALNKRGNPKYLLVHSDQGAQYTSAEFQDNADALDIVHSFSRPGKPADNSIAEGFFSVLKREEYRKHDYASIPELKRAIERYIEWYNNERAHSALGYLSPVDYENKKRIALRHRK